MLMIALFLLYPVHVLSMFVLRSTSIPEIKSIQSTLPPGYFMQAHSEQECLSCRGMLDHTSSMHRSHGSAWYLPPSYITLTLCWAPATTAEPKSSSGGIYARISRRRLMGAYADEEHTSSCIQVCIWWVICTVQHDNGLSDKQDKKEILLRAAVKLWCLYSWIQFV
jgi:hypothetical protein